VKESLLLSIKKEEFEEAAALRDKIKFLEKKIKEHAKEHSHVKDHTKEHKSS
jgi:protein-arginine kinase activator protein McsA